MPIRLFSRCSPCRRRGGRRETQQNGVLFGVGRGSPAPEGGEAEWSAAARKGNEKETARASPPFGAGCFWLYTSSMNCDRSVHAPSELNRPFRQPVPGPCSAPSSAGTSAAFRTASPARIRLPSPGRARAGSRPPRAAPAPLRALRPLRRASQGDLLSSVRLFAALRGGIAVSAQLPELPSDREQPGGSHEEDKPTHHESFRSPHPMSQPGSHPSASANAHSLSAPGV